jgi:hypothetical protein
MYARLAAFWGTNHNCSNRIAQILKIGNNNRSAPLGDNARIINTNIHGAPRAWLSAFTHSTGGRFPFPRLASGLENVETRKPAELGRR